MAYLRTRGIALRCIEYSESSQVVLLCTPDLGQIHVLARGSRRPRKGGAGPLDVLTHYDIVLARRRAGNLHLLTEWAMRDTFPALREDLRSFWLAFYADEAVLACTSENPDDGAACDQLLTLLRRLEGRENAWLALFLFLTGFLKTVGCAPLTDRCAQCGGALHGRARFSPRSGGALCSGCAPADPTAFSTSAGALAVMSRMAAKGSRPPVLRVTQTQAAEVARAFNEQIQYHLGRELRTFRFLGLSAVGGRRLAALHGMGGRS